MAGFVPGKSFHKVTGRLWPVEQLQQIFGYRNAHIFPQRVFLSGIHNLLDDSGKIKDDEIRQRLKD